MQQCHCKQCSCDNLLPPLTFWVDDFLPTMAGGAVANEEYEAEDNGTDTPRATNALRAVLPPFRRAMRLDVASMLYRR